MLERSQECDNWCVVSKFHDVKEKPEERRQKNDIFCTNIKCSLNILVFGKKSQLEIYKKNPLSLFAVKFY